MERNINDKISNYILKLKENVHNKAIELGLSHDNGMDDRLYQMVQYILDYPEQEFYLTHADFEKRKRIKNTITCENRCCAKRADGEQCTRKRKDEDTLFCGTHVKGTPHGICEEMTDSHKTQSHKVAIWTQDIKGIMYYIDDNHNVYNSEDIMHRVNNPRIISKYVKNNDEYTIPEFNVYVN